MEGDNRASAAERASVAAQAAVVADESEKELEKGIDPSTMRTANVATGSPRLFQPLGPA